jgi:hypothetical protein
MNLWNPYVFRRGMDVHEMWDDLFDVRPIKLLYIAGRGFDVRAQYALRELIGNLSASGRRVEKAELLLVEFGDYELEPEIQLLTETNAKNLENLFAQFGTTSTISVRSGMMNDEEDLNANLALTLGTRKVIERITDQTDIVLDVSSLPRVVYLALMTNILHKLLPTHSDASCLVANNVNFQVLVAEDASLDGQIRAEDPSNELILIPGFAGAIHSESVLDWPIVWFPILGENRSSQLQKVMSLANIPNSAEICPVLPHPSLVPRRADNLLVEYSSLFQSGGAQTSNILLVHESNPFEAYRQLLKAMRRYRESLQVLGGCRLIVTPLGSKLLTLGAGLACFEMRPTNMNSERYAVAIPHAEPKRYTVRIEDLQRSAPELSVLVLTGESYA